MGLVVGPVDIESIELEPMPNSVIRLSELVADPDAAVIDFEQVISLDQALTARVLRMANSAWSNPRNPIETVSDAVVRMGGAQIVSMAVGNKVGGMMSGACPQYDLEESELWRHSIAAALAAQGLSRYASVSIPGSAFTASLLHDIGKLFLSRSMGLEEKEEIQRVIDVEKISYVAAEKKVLGVTHADVGGAIAQRWGFPTVLVDAIASHHDPDIEPCPLFDAVHIANAVAKLIGVGLGTEGLNLNLSSDCTKRLGLTTGGLEGLCAKARDELEDAETIFQGEKDGS